MGTTTNRAYRYPASTADTQLWDHFQDLADDVDTDMNTQVGRIAVLEDTDSKHSLTVLVQQSAQSIPYNTGTALTFGASSEVHDSHNWHSTSVNTSRITPLIAGMYRFAGTAFMAAPGSFDYDRIDVTVYKNGTEQAPRGRGQGVGLNNTSASMNTETYLAMNGSTDYCELYVEQQTSAGSGANNTAATGAFRSVFTCEYVRPL